MPITKRTEYMRRWRAAHPDKVRAQNTARAAYCRELTAAFMADALKAHGIQCNVCRTAKAELPDGSNARVCGVLCRRCALLVRTVRKHGLLTALAEYLTLR